jgi:hypothetical protein
LCSSPNISTTNKSREGEIGRECSRHEIIGKHRGFWWDSQKKKSQLVRFGFKWEGNIKRDLTGLGMNGVDWIHLAQNRDRWQAVTNTVLNHKIP